MGRSHFGTTGEGGGGLSQSKSKGLRKRLGTKLVQTTCNAFAFAVKFNIAAGSETVYMIMLQCCSINLRH